MKPSSNLGSSVEKLFFHAKSKDFKEIPGSPISYWASPALRSSFSKNKGLGELIDAKSGMSTTNNAQFLRVWHEVKLNDLSLGGIAPEYAKKSGKKWFPYIKGGTFRRWFGNLDFVVNWKNDGEEIKKFVVNNPRDPNTTHWSRRIFNSDKFFNELLAWSRISMGELSVRRYGPGMIFSDASNGGFGDSNRLDGATLLLNSKVVGSIMKILSPTINFYSGDIERIPTILPNENSKLEQLIALSKADWNDCETSWDFVNLRLLLPSNRQPTLKASYNKLRNQWREMTLEMQRLEEENNRIFIDAYGLQDELTPEVPLNEITLTCNPHYRYGGDKSEEELEAMLLADTMRELVSYAVGCMLGRYSLDKPGLILANQGETLADYLAQVPQPSFPADNDNVIPVLDGDWFADDITLRFRQFLRVALGEQHYDENLAFIEQALNVKGKRNYSLRDYFLGEFYTDHVKRYKKRPIYWLFSSPKGSFNALIYMHRYRPDTVSVVLKYLRDYREKLVTEKERQAAVSVNPASSQGEKTKALKEVDRLGKVLAELDDYERDVLYPLATEQKQIDLDDGVKVNYLKFGTALKKITGLEAKDED